MVSKEMSRRAPPARAGAFEPAHHVDLGQPALGRGRVEPGEEGRRPPRRRAGAPPGCRRARPRSSAPSAGCRGRAPRPPRRRPPPAGRRPRPARSPGRPPPARAAPSSAGPKASGAATVDLRRRGGRAPASSSFDGSVKSATRASAPRMAKASGTGVRAMSEPRTFSSQAIESGSVSTAAARSRVARPRASSARFSAELRPASSTGCGTIGRAGGGGWSGQARSTRFATRASADLPRAERLGERLDVLRRVQPGVEADAAAAGQRLDQPVRGLVLGMAPDLEGVEVDLAAHLQPVAAVDEDRRPVAGDDREPGRAGEAGQPGQPLVARRHVLALVRVGARHQEGVDAGLGHRRPQRREPRRRRSRAWCGGGNPAASARPFRLP